MTSHIARVLTLFVLASPAAAQTQITAGVIQGIVTDATGGVLPGVTVDVHNVDTNSTESRTTDGSGRFVVLQLRPGRYTVSFTLAGFSTIKQEELTLTVGQTINLQPRMVPSSVQETVTVTGTPTVETTRSGVASTIDERTVETTPILGRKFEDLLTLTPGVSVVQGPDGDEISFAGQRGVF